MASLVLDASVPDADPATRPKVGKFRKPVPPTFDDPAERRQYFKGRLALAARIMDGEGWGVGCSVGLSCRDPNEADLVWVIPRGKPLRAMGSKDLIGVRLDGSVAHPVEGREPDPEWTPLHLVIYAARLDMGGVATGHTPHARVFSARLEAPKMCWQDSCTFYKRIHPLPFELALDPVSNAEKIAETLGSNGKGLILQHRGLLLCSATIEGAVGYYIRLENLLGGQLLVESACKGLGQNKDKEMIEIGEEEIQFTFDNVGSEHHAWMLAMPYYSRYDRKTGGAMKV